MGKSAPLEDHINAYNLRRWQCKKFELEIFIQHLSEAMLDNMCWPCGGCGINTINCTLIFSSAHAVCTD